MTQLANDTDATVDKEHESGSALTNMGSALYKTVEVPPMLKTVTMSSEEEFYQNTKIAVKI